MSASTTKALSLAIVAAVWAAISHLLKVNLQLWPVIVGLGCFVGTGGGVMGLQKSVLGTLSGIVWAALYISISGALGRQAFVDALVLGVAIFGMVYQARVPLLSYTATLEPRPSLPALIECRRPYAEPLSENGPVELTNCCRVSIQVGIFNP